MVSKGGEEDEVTGAGAEHVNESTGLLSGGCAGIDDVSWRHKLGSKYSDENFQETVEQLRQQLLKSRDVKKVKNVLRSLDISVNDELVALVKRYNFDSPGITFTPDNYDAWKRLASVQGSIDDARYFVHEMTEVKELQQTGFDFMGSTWANMTRKQKQQWQADFERYYMQAHSKALEAEYDFIAEQIFVAVNGRISISRTVIAAVDPTRKEACLYMLVDGVPLQAHQNFDFWQQRAKETVELSQSTRRKLGCNINPTLGELVRKVKGLKLNSL